MPAHLRRAGATAGVPGATKAPAASSSSRTIAQYEELTKSTDPETVASARRVLAKLRKPITLETLKTVAAMRQLAATRDPSVSGPATAWLLKNGYSTTEVPPAPSTTATKSAKTENGYSTTAPRPSLKIAERIIAIVQKASREGWPKSRREAEIFKVLDTEFPQARRQGR